MGEDDHELGDVGCTEANTVEAIGNVNLGEFSGAKTRVGMDKLAEEPWERSAELHGLRGRKADGLLIHSRVCVVHNQPWSPLSLWDDAEGGHPEVWKAESGGEREDGPKPLVTELQDLLADKTKVFFGRLVWAPSDSLTYALRVPGGCLEWNWGSPAAEVVEEATGFVGEMTNPGGNVRRRAKRSDKGIP